MIPQPREHATYVLSVQMKRHFRRLYAQLKTQVWCQLWGSNNDQLETRLEVHLREWLLLYSIRQGKS